jgi:hypothetical protein
MWFDFVIHSRRVTPARAVRGRSAYERYFLDKPRAEECRIVDVEADASSALLAVVVTYAGGAERRVKVIVRKCDPAWLVDWPATREL